jgi:hypothetical protein
MQKHDVAILSRSPEVRASIHELRALFADLLGELRLEPTDRQRARLRAFDNLQRLSLGRGETQALVAGDVHSTFSVADTPFEPVGDPGLTFPAPMSAGAFSKLDSIVPLAARLAVPETFAREKLVVALFLHRVVVRPGERYEGFAHRDIEQPEAPIGTVIFYPTVTAQHIDGAEVGVYLSDLPAEELNRDAPDLAYAPADYEQTALVLRYPHNLAHGVRPGTNRATPAPGPRTIEQDMNEFFDPGEATFVKDVAILTFSNTSSIEN